MRILVTGGTGICGRAVVSRLLDRGHEVRVLSRRESPKVPEGVETVTGDLARGTGLAEATAGVDTIVHCASSTQMPVYSRARKIDVEGTSRLIEAAKKDDEPHLVFISIVGIDQIPLGYYRAKLQTEKVIEAGGLPYTILRTTQFHDLIYEVCRGLASRMPVVLAPRGLRFQPVDVGEVADRMVELTLGSPRERAPDMGGPEVHRFDELAVSYLMATGRKRPVMTPFVPGRTMKAFREGHNLTDNATGTVRWEDWLGAEVGGTQG